MQRIAWTSAILCCVSFSGCVVPDHHHRPPVPRAAKIVVPAPAVVVPVPVVIESKPAKPCPPGQAKKGKC